MRDILFRAKKTGFNEWVEGLIVSYPEKTMCLLLERTPKLTWYVDENTVGQYTGLTDKNGKKIFEGDILEFADLAEDGYEYREAYDFVNRAVVGFIDGQFTLTEFAEDDTGVTDMVRGAEYYSRDELLGVIKESEVIGNIHDNPELLKGGEEKWQM